MSQGQSPPLLPLSYAAVPPTRKLDWLWHGVMFLSMLSFVGILLIPAVFIAPRFETIFKDFRTELPGLTKTILVICRWMGNDFGWIWVFLVSMALVGIGIALDATQPNNRLFRRYFWITTTLLTLVGLLWIALFMLGLFAPMFSLINTVSGPKK